MLKITHFTLNASIDRVAVHRLLLSTQLPKGAIVETLETSKVAINLGLRKGCHLLWLVMLKRKDNQLHMQANGFHRFVKCNHPSCSCRCKCENLHKSEKRSRLNWSNLKDAVEQRWMRPLCEGILFWFGKCCLLFHFHESHPRQWVIWQRILVAEVIHFPHCPAKVSWSWMCRATSWGKVWSQPSCTINTFMTSGNRAASILFPQWPLEV